VKRKTNLFDFAIPNRSLFSNKNNHPRTHFNYCVTLLLYSLSFCHFKRVCKTFFHNNDYFYRI
jgi:hypothetical protein